VPHTPVRVALVKALLTAVQEVIGSGPGSDTVSAHCSCTITDVEPDTPSAVAVMVADPLATAVSSPEGVTVATPSAEEDQLKL
jgi:hypothetical protein